MATLTAQTKLTVSDIVADAIALDVTMSPTVIAGGITSKTLTSARNTGSALTVAVFPWTAATDIEVFSTNGTEVPQLEIGIFSAA